MTVRNSYVRDPISVPAQTPVVPLPGSRPGWLGRNLRWRILAALCCVTVINFMDRQTLSVVAPILYRPIDQGGLGMTSQQFGYITFTFLITLGAGQLLNGMVLDKLGSRIGFFVSMTWWAIAAGCHRLVYSVLSLAFWRAALGLGESSTSPGASKTVSEWFPVQERGFATGIFVAGGTTGGIFGPPLVVWITLHLGWRNAFVAIGILALLWSIGWLCFYRLPRQDPRITDTELNHIEAGQATVVEKEGNRKLSWSQLLRYRQVWGIFVARALAEPVWWFYLFWIPTYLVHVRGISFKTMWIGAMLPYVTSDLGSLMGGGISSRLIAKGWSVNKARKTVILISAFLMPAALFVYHARTIWTALLLVCLATCAHSSWSTNLLVLPSDIFPQKVVASVAGLSGLGIAVSAFAQLMVGQIIAHFSYQPVFVIAGIMHPTAAICLHLLVGEIRQVKLRGDDPDFSIDPSALAI